MGNIINWPLMARPQRTARGRLNQVANRHLKFHCTCAALPRPSYSPSPETRRGSAKAVLGSSVDSRILGSSVDSRIFEAATGIQTSGSSVAAIVLSHKKVFSILDAETDSSRGVHRTPSAKNQISFSLCYAPFSIFDFCFALIAARLRLAAFSSWHHLRQRTYCCGCLGRYRGFLLLTTAGSVGLKPRLIPFLGINRRTGRRRSKTGFFCPSPRGLLPVVDPFERRSQRMPFGMI
jgi:hypothetical protein